MHGPIARLSTNCSAVSAENNLNVPKACQIRAAKWTPFKIEVTRNAFSVTRIFTYSIANSILGLDPLPERPVAAFEPIPEKGAADGVPLWKQRSGLVDDHVQEPAQFDAVQCDKPMLVGLFAAMFALRWFFIVRRALRPKTTARFDSMGIN